MEIEVKHLKKEFSYYKKMVGLSGSLHNLFHRETLTKEAVQDISFSVAKGEIIGLIGPNGAGKNHHLKNALRHFVPYLWSSVGGWIYPLGTQKCI